jgi:hypothetical protein
MHTYQNTKQTFINIPKKIPTKTPNAIEIPESRWNWFREINKRNMSPPSSSLLLTR